MTAIVADFWESMSATGLNGCDALRRTSHNSNFSHCYEINSKLFSPLNKDHFRLKHKNVPRTVTDTAVELIWREVRARKGERKEQRESRKEWRDLQPEKTDEKLSLMMMATC